MRRYRDAAHRRATPSDGARSAWCSPPPLRGLHSPAIMAHRGARPAQPSANWWSQSPVRPGHALDAVVRVGGSAMRDAVGFYTSYIRGFLRGRGFLVPPRSSRLEMSARAVALRRRPDDARRCRAMGHARRHASAPPGEVHVSRRRRSPGAVTACGGKRATLRGGRYEVALSRGAR
jgi:hypothetical protein